MESVLKYVIKPIVPSPSIEKTYGEKYLTQAKKEEAAKGHIQDAHEGIRPTDITREPVRVKESLSRDQFRLYPRPQLKHPRTAAVRYASFFC